MSGKALAWAVFGARGTGKTAWIKQLIARQKPRRLMVWDFKHDPSLQGMGEEHRSMPDFIRAVAATRFAVRFLPDHQRDMQAQFDLFCQAAWLAGDVLVFVDELPEVTRAGKAPAAWRRLVNVGREYTTGQGGKVKRVSIIGAAQRPAEVDKSFIGNADVVHTGRLGYLSDAKAMSQAMGLRPEDFMHLADLEWIEKRADSPTPERGKLSFSNAKPAGKRAP